MTDIFSLDEVQALARKLAAKAERGGCYCLIGDLGAGKTEFARSFIRALCGEVTVASPTFNILQIYDRESWVVGRESIYHFDLYRLKDASELVEIGLEEALEKGITLIEWPEIAKDLLPDKRTEIHIEILDENRRKITIR